MISVVESPWRHFRREQEWLASLWWACCSNPSAVAKLLNKTKDDRRGSEDKKDECRLRPVNCSAEGCQVSRPALWCRVAAQRGVRGRNNAGGHLGAWPLSWPLPHCMLGSVKHLLKCSSWACSLSLSSRTFCLWVISSWRIPEGNMVHVKEGPTPSSHHVKRVQICRRCPAAVISHLPPS